MTYVTLAVTLICLSGRLFFRIMTMTYAPILQVDKLPAPDLRDFVRDDARKRRLTNIPIAPDDPHSPDV
ncbi:MAG: hypothetical protein OXN17_12730 [Candidatus Poribacteria bacterium]|nr:hypothetical protein [Candidatus Poribacteria bacterium]